MSASLVQQLFDPDAPPAPLPPIKRFAGMEIPGWFGDRPGGGYRGMDEELDAVPGETEAFFAGCDGTVYVYATVTGARRATGR